MKTVVINLKEHLVRCVGLPLVSEIPLALLLKYVCVYHSYLHLTDNAMLAISHLTNYLQLELTHPVCSGASALSPYAVGEPDNFVKDVVVAVQVLTNRLHSALVAMCAVSGMEHWSMIDFVDYNTHSYSLVVRIN